MMERRKFVGLFSVGMLASSLPIILAACSSPKTPSASTPPDAEAVKAAGSSPIAKAKDAADLVGNFTLVGTMTNLDQAGDLSTEVNGKKVYVFRNPTDQTLIALDPTCNHKGCPVKVNTESKNLICPCHGSQFGLDGSLTKGPATAGLPIYELREEGDNILVKVV